MPKAEGLSSLRLARRRGQTAAEKLGAGTLGIACDMGDPTQIAAQFDQIKSNLGPVSMLVNYADIAAPGDFLETTLLHA